MLDQMFQGLKGSIEQMQGQDLSRVRDMVRSLNKMLEDRMEGRTPDFNGFMEKFGDMFPPGINSLDELLEHLQRQMAQMQSLLQSLSPEAREELRQMMDALLQDDSLRLELARLSGFMQAMMPPSELSERYPFFGEDPVNMGEAMGLMERLQQMDRLESQLERGSFRPDDVDRSLAQELLGDEARQALDQLRRVTDVLEKAGYVERKGRRMELTPRGMRRIGQSALRDIFDQLKKTRMGQHQLFRGGLGNEASDELKDYEYGDPFLMDLKETLFNALVREGPQVPVHIGGKDFVVHRTEHVTQASTVLMIDMSRSMFLRGCFLAAKKVAIALDSLIRSQYPAGLPVRGGVLELCGRAEAANAAPARPQRLRVRNEHAAWVPARPLTARKAPWEPPDHHDHGRRADRTPGRQRPRLLRVPADLQDHPADPS